MTDEAKAIRDASSEKMKPRVDIYKAGFDEGYEVASREHDLSVDKVKILLDAMKECLTIQESTPALSCSRYWRTIKFALTKFENEANNRRV